MVLMLFVIESQIYLIIKNRSVQGLSPTSFELEVVGYTIALAYCVSKRLPFSTYGEVSFLLIQGYKKFVMRLQNLAFHTRLGVK
jgi:hypothetical protein